MFSAMGAGGQSASTVGLGLNTPGSAVVMDSLMVPIEQSNSYAAMISPEGVEGGNTVAKEKNLEGLLVDGEQKHSVVTVQQPLPDVGGGSMASPPLRF